jgi:phytoene dehydrogenase-like protein
MTDVIVIGGGLNGLVAATWLARQKLQVMLFEQRPVVGGGAVSSELAPGFRVPELSHSLGPVARDVIRGLRLDRAAGLEFLTPDPSLTSFTADGRALVFHRDDVLTAASIHALSSRDAGRWSEFKRTVHRIAGVLAELDRHAPPGFDGLSGRDWWALLRTGRHARSLGRRDLIPTDPVDADVHRRPDERVVRDRATSRRDRRARAVSAIRPAPGPRAPAPCSCRARRRIPYRSAVASR